MDIDTGDISVVLAGAAGQGIQTIESMLTHVVRDSGYYVFSTKEYLSRIRGGCNSTLIRISHKKVAAFSSSIDILFALSPLALAHCSKRMTPKTIVIGDSSRIGQGVTHDIPVAKMAAECGGSLYENTIATAVVMGFLSLGKVHLGEFIQKRYAKKTQKILDANNAAALAGYEAGKALASCGTPFSLGANPLQKDVPLLMSGADALTLGALAGGCNFIASYPMSPGTGLLTGLAGYKRDFPLVVEQAEDEIAAIIMGLGAWYAGARAAVTTSGGGFALMTEGISLSGMIETPIVVNIGMRPGPGTGLPTRTEQGDLDLALYAGHGEFPRAIYAPGTPEEIYECTRKAFETADIFQSPAILLTDQFLVDSYFQTPLFTVEESKAYNHIVPTKKEYQRFALTKDPISPRGIPGNGEGLVRVDSDEHTENGILTERLDIRVAMQNKRLAKHTGLVADALAPEYRGESAAEVLIVTFGSTKGPVAEALEKCGDKRLAHLHCKQVYPLSAMVETLCGKRSKIVVVENNSTAQFARLLKRECVLTAPVESVLQYDGMPFSVETLVKAFETV